VHRRRTPSVGVDVEPVERDQDLVRVWLAARRLVEPTTTSINSPKPSASNASWTTSWRWH
jgi:hypothetical protein